MLAVLSVNACCLNDCGHRGFREWPGLGALCLTGFQNVGLSWAFKNSLSCHLEVLLHLCDMQDLPKGWDCVLLILISW